MGKNLMHFLMREGIYECLNFDLANDMPFTLGVLAIQ